MRQLVVFIEVADGDDGDRVGRYGSGIIAGTGTDSLYIATAHHVLQNAGPNTRVSVRFHWQPDAQFDAEILPRRDAELDVGVIRVTGLDRTGVRLDALPFDRVRFDPLDRGEELYLVGAPRGRRWAINAQPEVFSAHNGRLLEFESRFLDSGHSGGALLDADRMVVGMLRSGTPPYGDAVSASALRDLLKTWGYPVRLGTRSQPTEFVSVDVNKHTICAISRDRTAFCWGYTGSWDWLEQVGTKRWHQEPTRVHGGQAWASISAGTWHRCGVTADDIGYCWGNNTYGQLGDESGRHTLIPQQVGGDLKLTSIAAGSFSTCAIGVDGNIYQLHFATQLRTQGNFASIETVAAASDRYVVSERNGDQVMLNENCALVQGGLRQCTLNTRGRLDCSGDASWPDDYFSSRRFRFVDATANQGCAVDRAGVTHCWYGIQDRWFGQSTVAPHELPLRVRLKSVTGSNLLGCGIDAAFQLHCWGGYDGSLADDQPLNYGEGRRVGASGN